MRVWKRVSLFLSVLVVLAALYMTPLFGNKPAVIVSGSMEPTIQTGEFLVVHFSDFEDCEVGDVLTYYHPGLASAITGSRETPSPQGTTSRSFRISFTER